MADQVGQDRTVVVVEDLGAFGDVDLEVGTGRSVLAVAGSVGAALGPPVRMVAERQEGGDVVVGDEPDIATATAVAAVGAALGDVGLSAHGDGPGAAVTAANVEGDVVDESGHRATVGGHSIAAAPALLDESVTR
jgi:hypothetical protein